MPSQCNATQIVGIWAAEREKIRVAAHAAACTISFSDEIASWYLKSQFDETCYVIDCKR